MFKHALSGGLVALNLIFGTQASADAIIKDDANAETPFPDCTALSGAQVRYIPLATDDPLWLGSSVAFARYDEGGAVVYYDAEIFNQLSLTAQMQIASHECAHHALGHSEQTRNFRALNVSISPYVKQRKEKDADCEAIYSMAEDLGITREDITMIYDEIYHVLSGGAKMDPTIFARRVRAQECHDGFFDRPQPFKHNELTP